MTSFILIEVFSVSEAEHVSKAEHAPSRGVLEEEEGGGGGGKGQQASCLAAKQLRLWNFHRYRLVYLYNNYRKLHNCWSELTPPTTACLILLQVLNSYPVGVE